MTRNQSEKGFSDKDIEPKNSFLRKVHSSHIMPGKLGVSYPLFWTGTVLGPFWNRSGTVLGLFWDFFETVPDSPAFPNGS